jgi:serine/threonine-protein kinase HipA
MPWDADVFQGSRLAARIERTPLGSQLKFDPEFLNSPPEFPGRLFQLIPYSSEPLEQIGINLHPSFLNLLPEGARLDMVMQNHRLAQDDFLGLLMQIGWDTIGDVVILPTGNGFPIRPSRTRLEPGQMDFASFLSNGLNSQSDDAAIPGVQDKLSSAMFAMPISTQKWPAAILKLNPRRYPRLVQNEEFFLRMAKACGVDVCESKLVSDFRGEMGLMVRRFDRVQVKGSRQREKLHVEDACQLLGQIPANKYNLSLQAIAKAFQEVCTAPIIEIRRLIQLYAFSYVIGNTDLHGKNISLLWRQSNVVMAPAYDLPSSLPYPELDAHMAIKMDGRDDNFKPQHFIEFGERHHVSSRAVIADLNAMTRAAESWVARLSEIGFTDSETYRIRDEILRRRDRISV